MLVSHGHTKQAILHEYNVYEIQLFCEKIASEEMRKEADFIEGVVAGIGGAFGDYKKLEKSLSSMREGGRTDGN